MFSFCGAAKVGGMICHPELGNDFGDEVAVTEKPDHRAFRYDDAHCLGDRAHVGGCDVTAAEPEWHLDLRGYSVQISACRKENPVATHHEAAVQLCQFLNGSAEVEIS